MIPGVLATIHAHTIIIGLLAGWHALVLLWHAVAQASMTVTRYRGTTHEHKDEGASLTDGWHLSITQRHRV